MFCKVCDVCDKRLVKGENYVWFSYTNGRTERPINSGHVCATCFNKITALLDVNPSKTADDTFDCASNDMF